jgi:hypothetical protein
MVSIIKIFSFIVLVVLLSCLDLVCSSNKIEPGTFFLSPQGNDLKGTGSKSNPWKSIEKARDYIRSEGLNENMKHDIIVYLRKGTYELTSTLQFRSEDSGQGCYNIIYKAYPGEVPIISGGKQIIGWKEVKGKPYWEASLAEGGFADYFRQLYVNDVRAERATSSWVKASGKWYDDPETEETADGIYFNASCLKNYSNIRDLRLLNACSFKIEEFPVIAIKTEGDEKILQLAQPHFAMRHKRGYLFNDSDYLIINAIEELDEPGEWYLDRYNKKVFYYPYSYEKIEEVKAYAPVLEQLIRFEGTQSNKVSNLVFEGITFEYSNWIMPRDRHIGGAQAELLLSDTIGGDYDQAIPGGILLNHVYNFKFSNNIVRHFGTCGFYLINGVSNVLIEGNSFWDLTASSIQIGRPKSDIIDNDIPGEERCHDIIIRNNLIRNIGTIDFWGATAINLINTFNCEIVHNDISDISYMGIHQRNFAGKRVLINELGKTSILNNRVLYAGSAARYGINDGASIYSFGPQPGTLIQKNYVRNSGFNGIYIDNDSYGVIIRSNISEKSYYQDYCLPSRILDPSTIVFENNYGTNGYFGWNKKVEIINYFEIPDADWPLEARKVIAEAGLMPNYSQLLKTSYDQNIAAAKKVTSSGDDGNIAGLAVDGDYNTMWQFVPEKDQNAWLQVDLKSEYVIRKIGICPGKYTDFPEARKNIQVLGSNSPDFKDGLVLWEQNETPFKFRHYRSGYHPFSSKIGNEYNHSNNLIKYINQPKAFRYIRIRKTDSQVFNLSELEIFGFPK